MSNLNEIKTWLEGRLPALLAENEVPGAAVAVYAGGEVIDLAGGVLSKATEVEATADSLFQIGSITKVWTTTLVMQLVDEGLVDLDEPMRTYLPEFVISDESAAKVITVRQLLSHQAGFEGDIFTDTGMGDDCVEKYVATLSDVDQLFAPGEMFSYNNAGFCVLGRMVEVLRGKSYDSCLREHLFTPLGLTHAANGANEAILFRAAVGHIRPEPDVAPVPAPIWSLVRSNAPAGSSLAMRPRDLLAFAAMHLHSGAAADGTQVLSAASVKAMQERQVEVPDLGLMGNAWGLGWELFDWDGGPVIGHDGGTIGQSAFLRVVPEQDIAVALLTNGGDTFAVYTEIFSHVLRELAGIAMPALPTPPAEQLPFDAERFLGTYSCEIGDLTVSQDDEGRLWLQTVPKGAVAELVGDGERVEMLYLRENTLIPAKPDRGVHLPNIFLGDDGSGRALYLHAGRAIRRATPA